MPWLNFSRLLDDNDAEIQSKVLDCLLMWKDDFLIPYEQHLKNLISPKTLREELTRWSLSKENNHIDERHRPNLIPLVTRLLMPKVRKLKVLGSRKVYSLLGTIYIVYDDTRNNIFVILEIFQHLFLFVEHTCVHGLFMLIDY